MFRIKVYFPFLFHNAYLFMLPIYKINDMQIKYIFDIQHKQTNTVSVCHHLSRSGLWKNMSKTRPVSNAITHVIHIWTLVFIELRLKSMKTVAASIFLMKEELLVNARKRARICRDLQCLGYYYILPLAVLVYYQFPSMFEILAMTR